MLLCDVQYDFIQAKRARALQRRIGQPSTKYFTWYMNNNLIPNCPISAQDTRNAEFVWGPEIGSLMPTLTVRANADAHEFFRLPRSCSRRPPSLRACFST